MDNHTVVLGAPEAAQSDISVDMLGANYVYDYERIGDLPWERFDELIDALGSETLRYPGGNAAETTFNYLDPNSSYDLAGRPVMGMADFFDFAGTRAIDPTIILPTKWFLPNESHALLMWDNSINGWAIDPAAEAAARAMVENFVQEAVTAALAAGVDIRAIELGNEYPGVTYVGDDGNTWHMSGTQYGLMSDKLAQWVDAALATYGATGDPKVVVQVWGDYNHDGVNPISLSQSNDNVLAEFSAEGLAAIDGTASHIYYREGKTTADGNYTHTYATLDQRIAEMAALSDIWETAAGRDLTLHVTEWNVQKRSIYEPTEAYWQANSTWNVSDDWVETANFGMAQLAPMLEMVSAFNMEGVDAAEVWSVMYNAAALGIQDNGGQLTPAGELFALMADILPGTRYHEVNAESEHTDVHVFRGGGETYVFVSMLTEDPAHVTVDLAALSPLPDSVSVTYLRPDESTADGEFMADGNTYLVGDKVWLEADIGLSFDGGVVDLVDESISLALGAYEVALISFNDAHWNTISGSSATESLMGTDAADRIRGLDGQDYIRGEDGADWLEGGADADAIYGGGGADLLDGGDGDDWLQGGAGDGQDEIYGGYGDDFAFGGAGKDKVYGGHGHDTLHGDSGDDVLRGHGGRDTIIGGEGNDLIQGNGSRDRLEGGNGNDKIRGDAGNDTILGGNGADIFIYRFDKKSGNDKLWDFEDGIDLFEFRNGGSFDDLTVTQAGSHTDIEWDMGSIRVLDTSADLITAEDFVFL